MNARTEFVAPPYVANMQRVDSYADIDEILRSDTFKQGSHVESGVFFAGSLLLMHGQAHMERRLLFSSLVSVYAIVGLAVVLPKIAAQTHQAHQRIAEAIAAGDADLGERRMRRHLAAALDVLH